MAIALPNSKPNGQPRQLPVCLAKDWSGDYVFKFCLKTIDKKP